MRDNESFSDVVKKFYEEEATSLFSKVGFTISMPFSVVVAGFCKLGIQAYALLHQMSEKKNIEELVESEKLNIFNDEIIRPMTNEIPDLEEQLQLNGD